MIKKIVAVLLILLVLLLGGVLFVIYTQPGLRFAFSLVEKFVPELTVGQVNGRLTKLSLTDVAYQMPGVDVKIGQADLVISGHCLLRGEICVKKLSLEDSQIDVNTALIPPSETPEEETTEPLEIKAPLPIALKETSIKNLTLNIDGTQVELGEFKTNAAWVKRLLTLYPTQINHLKITLPDVPQEGITKTTEPKTSTNQAAKTVEQQTIGQQLNALFSQPLITTLPEVTLPLQVDIQELQGNDLIFHQGRDYVIDSLTIKAQAKDKGINIQTFKANGPEGEADIKGKVTLSDRWPVDLSAVAVANLPEGKESVTLSLSGAVMDKLMLDLQASGLVGAKLKAETALATKNIPSKFILESKKLRWPLTGKAQYLAKNVNIDFHGDVQNYQLSAQTAVQGQDIPAAKLNLQGKGGLTYFDLSQLVVDVFGGNVQSSGKVSWADQVAWDANLQANKINTVSQLPDFPMIINGGLQTKGAWKGETWNVTVSQLDLKGDLKKRPIQVSGSLMGDSSGRWDFNKVDALWGNNHVQINGHVSDKLQLTADVNVKELTLISPDLKGTLVGKADVKGSLAKPQAQVNLTANALSFQNWQLGQASLVGDVKSEKEISGNITLKASNIKGDGVDIKTINAKFAGSESQHQLDLQLNGKPVDGKLALNGRFDRHKMLWNGQLRDTVLNTPAGKWNMNQPAQLQYAVNDSAFKIGEHCWLTRGAKICLPKPAVIASAGDVQVRIDEFNLWKISQFLGDGLALRGTLTGDVHAKWKANQGMPDIDGNIEGKDITVLQGDGIQPLPIRFDLFSLKTQIKNNAVDANLLAQVKNNGKITSQIRITDPQNRKNLSGNFVIDHITMAILEPLLQKNETAEGVLNGNLALSGQLTDPLIKGDINLSKVKIASSLLPLDVKSADVALKFTGKESTLNGEIKSGNGSLNLTGSANWRVLENWNAQLKAKGDEIRVNVPPMVELKFTPDIEIAANAKAINLKGSVAIPWARITVESLPESAVDVSGDEVMLNAKLEPVTPIDNTKIPMEVNSNLAIKIGDDVELSAYGLIAKLKGVLFVKQNRRGLGLNGEVTIPEGRFHAYGQDLLIKKGELIFSGPVDQPMLNIYAIRNPESIEGNVTAGIKVTGLADEPKIEIYSEPAMSQQEALSYLLRGQGLSNESGGNDNDMMTAILIGLGASQGGKYIGKVGEAFGIRDLSLDTQGVGDGSQVVVSGYILPNLQLKYGIGIFDSLATFTLRYRLMPKLYLEAVSGLDQAVDLIYQFEF